MKNSAAKKFLILCAAIVIVTVGVLAYLKQSQTEQTTLAAVNRSSGIGAAGYKRIASAEIVNCFDLKTAVNISIREENLLSELQELPT